MRGDWDVENVSLYLRLHDNFNFDSLYHFTVSDKVCTWEWTSCYITLNLFKCLWSGQGNRLHTCVRLQPPLNLPGFGQNLLKFYPCQKLMLSARTFIRITKDHHDLQYSRNPLMSYLCEKRSSCYCCIYNVDPNQNCWKYIWRKKALPNEISQMFSLHDHCCKVVSGLGWHLNGHFFFRLTGGNRLFVVYHSWDKVFIYCIKDCYSE